MSERSEHVYTKDEKKLHDSMKSCLDLHSECEGYRQSNNDCCYRWQAHAFARSGQRDIFDTRSDALVGKTRRKTLPTSAYVPTGKEGKAGTRDRIVPQFYAFRIRLPQYPGDWCLDGPTRAGHGASPMLKHHIKGQSVNVPMKDSVRDGTNFRKQAYPYWNEAHHLIAKEMFATEIGKFQQVPPSTIRLALLNSGYNIHSQINMQLLPGDVEVGKLLQLPRHLALEGNGKFNHEAYNMLVEVRLDEVLQDISGDVDQKKHAFKNPDTSKAKLENISKDCRKRLLDFGGIGGAGKSLDEVEFIEWTHPTPPINSQGLITP